MEKLEKVAQTPDHKKVKFVWPPEKKDTSPTSVRRQRKRTDKSHRRSGVFENQPAESGADFRVSDDLLVDFFLADLGRLRTKVDLRE